MKCNHGFDGRLAFYNCRHGDVRTGATRIVKNEEEGRDWFNEYICEDSVEGGRPFLTPKPSLMEVTL